MEFFNLYISYSICFLWIKSLYDFLSYILRSNCYDGVDEYYVIVKESGSREEQEEQEETKTKKAKLKAHIFFSVIYHFEIVSVNI